MNSGIIFIEPRNPRERMVAGRDYIFDITLTLPDHLWRKMRNLPIEARMKTLDDAHLTLRMFQPDGSSTAITHSGNALKALVKDTRTFTDEVTWNIRPDLMGHTSENLKIEAHLIDKSSGRDVYWASNGRYFLVEPAPQQTTHQRHGALLRHNAPHFRP